MKSKAKIAAYMIAALVGAANSSKVYAQAPEVIDQEIIGEDTLEEKRYVKALEDINIYDSVNQDNVIGFMSAGQTLPFSCLWDEGYYEIEYNDALGYVECNKSDVIFKYDFENMITFINDTTMSRDDNTTVEVEQYSVGKLLRDNIGSWSMVEVDDKIGYVNTSDIEILDDTFVLVDLSDQNLKLYNNNEIILDCPVITGKDKTPTTCGSFEVYEKRYDTVLRDAKRTYASPVDVFMKFHDGEGLHDAYRWRNDSEYEIKDYYKNHGSHGCVNMRREDALFVSDYVDVGTKVLVRK